MSIQKEWVNIEEAVELFDKSDSTIRRISKRESVQKDYVEQKMVLKFSDLVKIYGAPELTDIIELRERKTVQKTEVMEPEKKPLSEDYKTTKMLTSSAAEDYKELVETYKKDIERLNEEVGRKEARVVALETKNDGVLETLNEFRKDYEKELSQTRSLHWEDKKELNKLRQALQNTEGELNALQLRLTNEFVPKSTKFRKWWLIWTWHLPSRD